MPKIHFTMKEKELMRMSVSEGHNSWGEGYLSDIKKKIKQENLRRQFNCCCYCSRSMQGEFNLVIDIEHILPKAQYTHHMFTSKNLSVSCKRCNMLLKNDDLGFLHEKYYPLPKRAFKSKYYKFVHPNIDSIESHINLEIVRVSRTKQIIKYVIVNSSSKGRFNYEYFDLSKLEINAFNEAQGIHTINPIDDIKLSDAYDQLVKNQF